MGPNLVKRHNFSSQRLPTPINPDRLAHYLIGYDKTKFDYLIKGFAEGFELEFEGERGFQFSLNLQSALDNNNVVGVKIAKELQGGHIAGPFSDLPFGSLKISPLGIVPKTTPNQFRMIHHLSNPKKEECSVNAGISDESVAVHYAGINDALSFIKEIGTGAFCYNSFCFQNFTIPPENTNC